MNSETMNNNMNSIVTAMKALSGLVAMANRQVLGIIVVVVLSVIIIK